MSPGGYAGIVVPALEPRAKVAQVVRKRSSVMASGRQLGSPLAGWKTLIGLSAIARDRAGDSLDADGGIARSRADRIAAYETELIFKKWQAERAPASNLPADDRPWDESFKQLDNYCFAQARRMWRDGVDRSRQARLSAIIVAGALRLPLRELHHVTCCLIDRRQPVETAEFPTGLQQRSLLCDGEGSCIPEKSVHRFAA